MHSSQNTAYAIRNGVLIHVSEASRGDSCECICIVCNAPLIAKKGAIRRHHFAHSADSNCTGAAESVLHLLSKDLFMEMRSIMLPAYFYQISRELKGGGEVTHGQEVAKGGEVRIDGVEIESSENGFIPDVILHSGNKKLIVEIAVTHKVGREKLRRIRKTSLPAIEILLKVTDALLSRDELREKLSRDFHSKKWLFHPKQREVERILLSKFRDANRERRRLARESIVRTRPLNTLPIIKKANTPPQKVIQPRPQYFVSSYELRKYDQDLYNFRIKNGRYPSQEEGARLWPHIWKKN